MTWALVTGATSGIGRCFVQHLAAQGYDIVLVARDADRLEAVAAQVADAAGIRTEVFVADLSDRAAIEAVAVRLRSRDEPIDVLVNNAGFSTNQLFVSGDLEREEAALDVMVRAVMVLSQASALAMTARHHGRIINVSSVAAWVPGGTYSAAKSWVSTFTEALAGELAGSGVTATVLCPGYTRTEFHERAGLDMSGVPDIAWLAVDDVVAQGLRDSERGRPVSVPSPLYRTARIGLKLLPAAVVRRIALRRPGSAR